MAYGYPTHPVQPVDPQPTPAPAPPPQAEGEPWQVMRDRRVREFLAANPSRRAPPRRQPVMPQTPATPNVTTPMGDGPNATASPVRNDVELPAKPAGFVAGGDGSARVAGVADGPNAMPAGVKPLGTPFDKTRLLAAIGPRRYRRP